jgi:hypothetical protein
MRARRTIFALTLAAAALAASAAPACAQGNVKHFAVSPDKAMSATRTVLDRQGFEIVRTAGDAEAQVVYYRRSDRGHGRGQGPMERLVIRRVKRHVVFEDVPSGILADLEYELKL